MRCRGCGYELFDIEPGPCPECGREFSPLEFRFKPRRVGFLCPACGHGYQGLDVDGLPHPKQFVCKECGAQVDAAHMIVTLPEGARADDVMVLESPWEGRKEIGVVKAFWRTLGWSFVRPEAVTRDLEKQGRVTDAFRFATRVYALVILVYAGFIGAVSLIFAGGFTIGGSLTGLGMAILMMLLVSGVFIFVWIPLWALAAHGVLKITGEKRGGYGLTLRALLYAQGPTIVGVLPYCGHFIGGVWSTISAAMMIKAAQRVHGGRATMAALVMPLASIGAVVVFYGWLLYIAGAQFGNLSMATRVGPSPIGMALLERVGDDGSTVDHVLDLVDGRANRAQMLIWPQRVYIQGAGMDLPLPENRTIQDLRDMDVEEIRALREALANNDDFYSFCGMIYAHRRVDFNAAPADLIIAYSSPAFVDATYPWIMAIKADGSNWSYYETDWIDELRNQDALREELGLPMLPWESDLPPTLEDLFGGAASEDNAPPF